MLRQETYIRHRRRMRAAVTSKDPTRILRAVREAREAFEQEGFPDRWPEFRNAASDAATRCMLASRDWRTEDISGIGSLGYLLEEEASRW